MTAERRVSISGLGYIGLPTASVLAHHGWNVHGVETNPSVVERISRGEAHIAEPDIDTMVHSAVHSGALTASAEPVPSDVFMICVPTPFLRDTNPPEPDLEHVFSAAHALVPYLRAGNLVIIESTCPVGTTQRVQEALQIAGAPHEVRFAYCPERVLPGRIIQELVSNDRVVGGIDAESSVAAEAFYRSFVNGAIFATDSRTAEMVKLAENSFRDVNIAFANEISVLCDRMRIDPWQLIRLANRHPRVNILSPGPGVGGHCIAVDPWFLVADDPEHTPLIRAAREVNDAKPNWVVEQIRHAALGTGVRDRPVRIACLGLSYKADVDDLRESPALRVALALDDAGFEVLACEPNLTRHETLRLWPLQEAIQNADLVVLLVAHRAFRRVDFNGRRVLDFCGALPQVGDGTGDRARGLVTGVPD